VYKDPPLTAHRIGRWRVALADFVAGRDPEELLRGVDRNLGVARDLFSTGRLIAG
jgi:hypothetical protein